MSAFFSGDPLPIAPAMGDGSDSSIAASNFIELEAFNRKLLEYLRRLGLHLSNPDLVTTPSGTSGVESLVVVATSDIDISGTPDTIVWNRILREDAPFSYDTSTGVVTINEDGFYLFMVDFHCPDDNVFTTEFYDGTTTYPYGRTRIQEATPNNVWPQTSCAVPMHLHATQTMEFRAINANGASFEAETTRMTVLKLGSFAGTGTTDPCDFDIWQLCP